MKRITILTIAAFFLAELASQAERYYYFEHLKLRKTRHAPRGAVYGVRELCKGRGWQSHIRGYVSVCDTEKGMGAEQ